LFDKFVEAFHEPEIYVIVMLLALGKGTKPGRGKVRFPFDERLQWNKY
jgi:hypothetical protein